MIKRKLDQAAAEKAAAEKAAAEKAAAEKAAAENTEEDQAEKDTNKNPQKSGTTVCSWWSIIKIPFVLMAGLTWIYWPTILEVQRDYDEGWQKGDLKVGLQRHLCQDYYSKSFFSVNLEPWSDSQESQVNLDKMFINQTFYIKKKKEEHTDLLDFFSWDQESTPRRLLLVA